MSENFDAIIIGAGLAGLSCAFNLHKSGFKPLILEASDGPGGRLRTDLYKGYRLDRGFQVFLTAYPEAIKQLDYAALDLVPFFSGALVRHGGSFTRVADPIREPQALFATLISDIAPMHDKLKIAYLRQKVMNMTVQDIFRQPERTILKALNEYGFSSRIIDRFFRPFFGGITLDASLSGSSRMFEFIFKMMAEGHVTVPRLGMGKITEQMAAKLPEDCIRYNSPVKNIDFENSSVVLSGDRRLKARAIIVATEGLEAKRLCPSIQAPGFREVTCLYFSADKAPTQEPLLVLNGDINPDGDQSKSGLINNLAVLTNVSPELAPPGKHLISVSVLDDQGLSQENLIDKVAQELQTWFGTEASSYEHIKNYQIRQALPDQSPPWLETSQKPVSISESGQTIYLCGDHRETASIHGAMVSGRRAAEQVAKDLKVALSI